MTFVQIFHTLGSMKDRIAVFGLDTGRVDESLLRYSVEEKVTQWAGRIIAATPAEYSQLVWLYRTDREKIQIVPPGVDLSSFYPGEAIHNVRAQLGLSDDSQVLLFAGRLEPLKAVDVVLEALCILRRENPASVRKLVFVVVGGTEYSSEVSRLRQYAQNLGLGSIVRFVGVLDQSILVDFYRIALAVVVPSDYESFGMVALEAMACGALVIASGVGGLAYLVDDGEAGWLVPTRDARALADRVRDLMVNPEIRGRLGAVAARAAERYSWAQVVFRLRVVFQGLSGGDLAAV
jgi:D-inositol-3-phosphate glycosyltransferase